MPFTATPYVASLLRLRAPTQLCQIHVHAINASTFLGKASVLALDIPKVAMNSGNE